MNEQQFLRFLGEKPMHDINLALYSDGTVRIEDERTAWPVGNALHFPDAQSALSWYESLPADSDDARLSMAIDIVGDVESYC